IIKPMANVFVSHCWAFEFAQVIKSLSDTIPNDQYDSTFIWFDAIVVNQHVRTNVSQEWWSKVFRSNVQRIGHTILVLGDWASPMPLTRAWCLWEILSSIEVGGNSSSTFQISVSKSEED